MTKPSPAAQYFSVNSFAVFFAPVKHVYFSATRYATARMTVATKNYPTKKIAQNIRPHRKSYLQLQQRNPWSFPVTPLVSTGCSNAIMATVYRIGGGVTASMIVVIIQMKLVAVSTLNPARCCLNMTVQGARAGKTSLLVCLVCTTILRYFYYIF